MATTMLPMGEPTNAEADATLTRREIVVLALVLALVVGSVLLLVVASGQVAAALSGPN